MQLPKELQEAKDREIIKGFSFDRANQIVHQIGHNYINSLDAIKEASKLILSKKGGAGSSKNNPLILGSGKKNFGVINFTREAITGENIAKVDKTIWNKIRPVLKQTEFNNLNGVIVEELHTNTALSLGTIKVVKQGTTQAPPYSEFIQKIKSIKKATGLNDKQIRKNSLPTFDKSSEINPG